MINGSRVEWVSCDVTSDAPPAVADDTRLLDSLSCSLFTYLTEC